MLQRLCILGSTGAIGDSTLAVVAGNPDAFVVYALSAHRNIEKLFKQCLRYKPALAIVSEPHHAIELQAHLQAAQLPTEVGCGLDALCAASAGECDTVVAAIVGAAGLLPTLSAARAGKKILLANKEALVMSGALFMDTSRESGALILPIDSEHNAIFQCLQGSRDGLVGVDRLILTASGGPFRTRSVASLKDVTPKEACAHPNWVMGRKISVDSATMINKGLEIIEARWLFDIAPSRIEALIHPQSIVHSMVVFRDQSVLAQLGRPDMRTPIAHALGYPHRVLSGVPSLDLTQLSGLTFEEPDLQRFPCLELAMAVINEHPEASVILNASNEVAVDAFLSSRIRFTDIERVIRHTLQRVTATTLDSLEDILDKDEQARAVSRESIALL
ncbi:MULTISPECIES: 1-deoxy-D-xylulose-5-phosphate reductoisomerase [unclassified Pseudomonas]|jgi:1-deoxy-D-xylulose-5-phosphate reductoisomerase|uniref:1-deoxy-D-xylulose-5-phosphate reductoisomerase n=1 Tax=unclassified Pseudomonas TaxID=196821 RepID=UPI00081BD305|nr:MULTISPECIES: 1-deoxy-D-xylulose-5-phosphate reductoisomerase [unclassified Pseudomonas]MCP1464165.1 1-deoxy-D-xylulose-5-phosphate reductoisomerase [Pseudomonas sp. S3E17]OCW22512.1 1-deoxy-D-xylulose-5-phosphate reductoisomerase [Pseudomonas sp. S3E12]